MLGCTWPRLESPWCQPQGTENWLSSRRHLSKITVSLGDAADPSSPTAASTSCGSLGVHSSCFWSGLSHRWNLGEVWRSRSKSLLVDLVRLMLISSLCTKQRREGGILFSLVQGRFHSSVTGLRAVESGRFGTTDPDCYLLCGLGQSLEHFWEFWTSMSSFV